MQSQLEVMELGLLLVQGIAASGGLMEAIWIRVGYTVLCVSSFPRPGASRNPYGALTKTLL